MPRAGAQAVGQCSVCGEGHALCPSSGLLRKHGGGRGRGCCVSSGSVPVEVGGVSLGVPMGGENILHSGGGDLNFRGVGLKLFYSGSILKRIPKGARLLGAAVLARTLKGVNDHPEEEEPWLRLLSFPGTLARPSRGGVRRNLTSSVLARLRVHDEGGILKGIEGGGGFYGKRRGKPVQKGVEGDREAARRASIKVGDGDVRGAVRVLCSDEGGISPDAASAA